LRLILTWRSSAASRTPDQPGRAGCVEKHDLDNDGTMFGLRIHPAVAEAGRAKARTAFQGVIDRLIADYWHIVMLTALQSYGTHPAAGRTIAHAGVAAYPYLGRAGSWSEAGAMVERTLHVDQSPSTVAAVLPLIRRVVDETAGTDGIYKYLLARALRLAGSTKEAENGLKEILNEADRRHDFKLASSVCLELASLFKDTGRPDEALQAAEQRAAYAQRSSLAWSLLSAEVQKLQALNSVGKYEEVLEQANALQGKVEEAPDPDESEMTLAWNVRELLFDTASAAAMHVGDKIAFENDQGAIRGVMSDAQRERAHRAWTQAMSYNVENLRSKIERSASALERAMVRFNDVGPLLRMLRLDKARRELIACRAIFEHEGAVSELGLVFSSFSTLESHEGRGAEARDFEEKALRYKYVGDDPATVAGSHFNLANRIFEGGGDLRQALAHRLAALLLAKASKSGRTARYLAHVSLLPL
jgi:tetratricopeptide (TPR) repeat protein